MYWELVKEFQKDPAQLERAQQRHYDKMPSDQMNRNIASDFKTDTFKAIGPMWVLKALQQLLRRRCSDSGQCANLWSCSV